MRPSVVLSRSQRNNNTALESLFQAGNQAFQSVIRGTKKPRRKIKYVKGVHKGRFYRHRVPSRAPQPVVPKLPVAGQAVMPQPLKNVPLAPPSLTTASTAEAVVQEATSGGGQQGSSTFSQRFERFKAWLRQNGPVLILNFGSLCTLTGFTRQDVLELRALSVTGSLTFIVYQIFQLPIRWPPIAWSALFAMVNGYNISKILVERKGKVTLTEHEEEIFVEHFMPHGVTPKQFEFILKKAHVVALRRGQVLIRQGDPLEKVWLVTKGATRASIGGRRLTAASTRPGDSVNKHGGDAGAWVGEMAFLDYFGKDEMEHERELQQEKDDQAPQPETPNKPIRRLAHALYTIVAQDDDVVVLEWTHDEIQDLMHKSTDMRASMTRAMTAPIVGKVINFSISRKQNALPTWSVWLDDWKHSGANVKTTLVQEEESDDPDVAMNPVM